MAVGFDQTAVASGAAVTTLTITAFNPGGLDRYLLVGVSQASTESVTSIIKGGSETFSSIASRSDSVGLIRCELFEFIAPAASSSNIVGTFTDVEGVGVTMGVVSFTGVDQTTPILTNVTNNGTGDPTTTHTSSANGFDMMIEAFARDLNYAPVSATERWDVLQADEPSAGGLTDPGVAGSNTLTADYAQVREWVMCAVSIQEVQAAGGIPFVGMPPMIGF